MYTTTPDLRSVYQSLRHGRPDGLDPSTTADLTADDRLRVMLRDAAHNVVVDVTFNGNADQPVSLAITPSSATPDAKPVRLSAVTVSRLNALLKGTGLEIQYSSRTGAHNLRAGAYRTCTLADGLTATTLRESGSEAWPEPTLSGGSAAPLAPVAAPAVTSPSTPRVEPNPVADLASRVPVSDETAVVLSKANLRKYEAVRTAHREHGHRSLIALRGPAGSGKTMAAKHFAAMEGLPFFKFDCAGVRDPDGWFGTWATTPSANGVGLEFQASDLLKAITLDQPAVLLLDEANRAAGTSIVALLPLLDLSGSITVPQTGRSVDINRDLQVMLTFNLGSEYMHVEPLDMAFQDRMGMTLKIPHLTKREEQALLLRRVPGLSVYHADLLTQLGVLIREAAAHGGKHRSVSTRRLLDAAQYIAAGLRPIEAVEGAIIDWYDDEGGAKSEQAQVRQHMTGLIWEDPTTTAQPSAQATPTASDTDDDGLATVDVTDIDIVLDDGGAF